jgi:hypothetical protein
METLCMATVPDDDQGVKLGPPYPTACLPRDVSTGVRGWPIRYPDVYPGGMVGYRSTQ